jgi:hypothetical protein
MHGPPWLHALGQQPKLIDLEGVATSEVDAMMSIFTHRAFSPLRCLHCIIDVYLLALFVAATFRLVKNVSMPCVPPLWNFPTFRALAMQRV